MSTTTQTGEQLEQTRRELLEELPTIERRARHVAIGAEAGNLDELQRRAREISAALARIDEQLAANRKAVLDQLRTAAAQHEKAGKKAVLEAHAAADSALAALQGFVGPFAAAVAAGDRLDAAQEAIARIAERWRAVTGEAAPLEFTIAHRYTHPLLTEHRGSAIRIAQICTYVGLGSSADGARFSPGAGLDTGS